MTRKTQKTMKATATREVTVKLTGWPKEVRRLSIVDPYWAVELSFKLPNGTHLSHAVFETLGYDKALAKYNAFLVIVAEG